MATTVFELEASFGIDSTKFKQGIKQAIEEAEKLRKELNKTGEDTNDLGREIDKEGKEAKDGAEENKKLGKEVKTAGDHADSAKSRFSALGDTLKTGFATAAKIGTAAIGAAAAGTTKLVKDSVSAYAEYEQLVGGVEAAFADNQGAIDTVIQSGANAWQTLQMSSNEYYQSFMSAYPLIKAGMEDQNEAIATTNRLMQLESDLANTFGYDASTAANAVNWALKGSYNYLDNLNIGIKGTKEGFLEAANASGLFEKEIEDVSELTTDQIVSVLESYAAQYGVLNRTQQEGATTIQGSLKSVKAAWRNLTVELAKSDGDIGGAFDILGKNVGSVVDNMLPKVEQALGGVGTLIEKSAPQITKSIEKLTPKIIPSLIKSAGSIVGSLGQGILQATPSLFDAGISVMGQLNSALRSGDSDGGSIINKLSDDISARIPTAFRFGRRILSAIADDILNVDYGKLAENLSKTVRSALGNMKDFVSGVDSEKIGESIADLISDVEWGKIISDIGGLIATAVKGVPGFLKGIVENLDFKGAADMLALLFAPKFVTAFTKQLATQLSQSAVTDVMSKQLSASAGVAAGQAAKTLIGAFSAALAGWEIGSLIYDKYGDKIDEFLEPFWENWFDGLEYLTELIGKVKDAFNEFFDSWRVGFDMIKSTIEEVGEKINKWGDFWSGFGEYVSDKVHGVDSNADGGYVSTPRLSWVAEKEPEYIIPESKMDKVYKNNSSTINVTVNVEGGISSDYDVDRMVERLSERMSMLSEWQSRALGGAGLG